jgi:GT2 family glycosyltransferase
VSVTPPGFSVIVPTRHRNDLLRTCLAALAPGAQRLTADQYEVIVTDDGSDVTARSMVRTEFPWARWTAGPRRGPAANRNSASRLARGSWLVFVDDDCVPDPGWLGAFADAIAGDPTCRVFEGRVYADRPRRSLAEIAPVFESGGELPSGNFACDASLFRWLGGFDERYPYPAMEDVDLRLRLIQAGERFSFVASASVRHPWRPKGGWSHLLRHQESVLIFLSIHPGELPRIRALYGPPAIWRAVTRETLPGLVRFRGKGFGEATLEHVAAVRMLWRLRAVGPRAGTVS